MDWLFSGWTPIAKAALAAPLMYFCIVAFVRISGKRSTSQMNNFDWIVTITLGSLVATPIIQPDTAILTVVFAVALLFALQWCVTWLTTRTVWAQRLFRASPTVLFYEGQFVRENMKRERVSSEEIISAMRNEGHGQLTQVHAVVLETDAKLSVLPVSGSNRFSTLEGCCGAAYFDPDDQAPPPPVRSQGGPGPHRS